VERIRERITATMRVMGAGDVDAMKPEHVTGLAAELHTTMVELAAAQEPLDDAQDPILSHSYRGASFLPISTRPLGFPYGMLRPTLHCACGD
jgi:hypothetical protein